MKSDLQGWAAGLAALSFILAIGWAWLERWQPDDQSWPVITGLWFRGAARFFYFVGLPYLALIFGLLTARLLGLKGLEHFGMIGTGGAVSTAQLVADIQYATVLMLLEWFIDSSRTILAGLAALVVLGSIWLGLARTGVDRTGVASLSLLDVIYHGLHWSFYRAVFWLITGDLYLGVILGMGLIIIEGLLVARLAGAWSAQQLPLFTNGMILILTAAVFFYSPNLWLLWPVHWAMIKLVSVFTLDLADSRPILSELPGRR